MKPVKVWLPDINKIIKNNNIKQVTSALIKEPSTNLFHPHGLYSEQIFGRISSPERMVTTGYIDLRTKVLHPNVYQNLIRLNRLFGEVMAGTSPAVFDDVKQTLVRPQYAPKDSAYPVGTGYAFFMKYLPKIKFEKNHSLTRNDRIAIIEKYQHELYIDKFLILPAGLRDIRLEDDRPQIEEINEFYVRLLSYSQVLPEGMSTEEDIWDNVRWSIQKTVYDIHEYILNIVKGGKGMMESKYAARSIAYGTRNVLTGADTSAISFTDPKRHKATETQVPLFQAMKAFLPFVLYHLKTVFFYSIFEEGSDLIYATKATDLNNPVFSFDQIRITSKVKNQFITSDGLEKMIENFRSPDVRKDPVGLIINGQSYWLYLIYADGPKTFLFRNYDEFCTYYQELYNTQPDPHKVRPLTYAELFYVATYMATHDKHVSVTRYPVLGPGSIYPSECVLLSTEPSEQVDYTNVLTGQSFTFYFYPNLNADFIDGLRIHPIWIPPLGGDYDGDQVNLVGIWDVKANNEARAHIYSYGYLLSPSGKARLPPKSDVSDIALRSLSRNKLNRETTKKVVMGKEADTFSIIDEISLDFSLMSFL
jgi:hypothetical protein